MNPRTWYSDDREAALGAMNQRVRKRLGGSRHEVVVGGRAHEFVLATFPLWRDSVAMGDFREDEGGPLVLMSVDLFKVTRHLAPVSLGGEVRRALRRMSDRLATIPSAKFVPVPLEPATGVACTDAVAILAWSTVELGRERAAVLCVALPEAQEALERMLGAFTRSVARLARGGRS